MADYWTSEDDPYIDKEHKVLKNLAGITSQQQLNIYEDAVADASMLEIMDFIKDESLTFELWKKVHKIMFRDVYEWAGKIRTVRMTKGTSLFANPQFIEFCGKDLFKELKSEGNLENLSLKKISERLSYYYNNFNAIHPFREGNGRSLKIIITEIARRAGYHIDWEKLSFQENITASIEGFNGNYEPFCKIYSEILSKI